MYIIHLTNFSKTIDISQSMRYNEVTEKEGNPSETARMGLLSFPPGGVRSAQGKITRKDVSPMYNEEEQSQTRGSTSASAT